jgi:transient receptor potential cation channel subfamily C protein 4
VLAGASSIQPLKASTSFTADVTPLILAAQRNNYEIVKILLDRGDTIAKPHDVRCSCLECRTKAQEDNLQHSLSRINAYKALASPSLIALSSADPILTAFELSDELRRLSRIENEYRVSIIVIYTAYVKYELICPRFPNA